MVCYWFCRVYCKFMCMFVENGFNCYCFIFVVVICVCFVSIDIINFFRCNICIFNGFLYCFCFIFIVLCWCCDMISVFCWVVVDNFFINFSVVGQGMFKFFKNDNFCFFIYNKVIMVFIEWVVCCFWIWISR